MLTHTSGIYDYLDDTDSPFFTDAFLGPNTDWTKVWTPRELLAYADGTNHAPYFDPGQGVYYSNTGYILLGLVVEAATGNPFGDELRTRILEPLALADTFLAEGGTMPTGTVDGYQMLEGELVNVSAINLSWAWTAGGIVSTSRTWPASPAPSSPGNWCRRRPRRRCSPSSRRAGSACEFGMGVIRTQTSNGELVGMDGGSAGGTSTMRRLAAADLTVVVLVNVAPDEGATEPCPRRGDPAGARVRLNRQRAAENPAALLIQNGGWCYGNSDDGACVQTVPGGRHVPCAHDRWDRGRGHADHR